MCAVVCASYFCSESVHCILRSAHSDGHGWPHWFQRFVRGLSRRHES